MLRFVVERVKLRLNKILPKMTSTAFLSRSSHDKNEYQKCDDKYEQYFCRPDIDHWEIRRAMNILAGMDAVPEPRIIRAALIACRKLNDYALTTRFLETVKSKCTTNPEKLYPYILQEIKPTLEELGISTPEELGYDKPELWLEDPDDLQ